MLNLVLFNLREQKVFVLLDHLHIMSFELAEI